MILFRGLICALVIGLAISCQGGKKGKNNNNASNNNVKNDKDLTSALGGNAKLVGAIDSSGSGKVIRNPKDVGCREFDSGCSWRNEKGNDQRRDIDELDWGVAQGNPDKNRFKSITGTDEFPTGRYAITGSGKALGANDAGLLVSGIIPCQQRDGELTFKYWTSPNTEIRVCMREPNGGKTSFYCSPPITGGDPGPARVNLPGPRLRPFEIYFEAKRFDFRVSDTQQGGLIAIDDVNYDGIICASDTEVSTDRTTPPTAAPTTQLSGTTRGSQGDSDQIACRALTCSFDQNGCGYDLVRAGWKQANNAVGNYHTGIRFPKQGNYVYAQGPGTDFPLKSSPFSLSSTKDLNFCFYRATANVVMKVVANEKGRGRKELWDSPRINAKPHEWICNSPVSIPAGEYDSVDLVVQNLPNENAYFAVDDIQLFDNRRPLC